MVALSKLYVLDVGVSKLGVNGLNNGRILSCKSDGSSLTELVSGLTTAPDGIAIDLETNTIFYTNMVVPSTDTGFISSVPLSGGTPKVIVPPGVTFTPKQLVLEHKTRKLYWCDREGMRVFRANLDGSEIEILVQTGTTDIDRQDPRNWCVGIAVDVERQMVFWTQKGPSKGNQGRLFCAGLDIPEDENAINRSDIRLLVDHLPEPIDLALDVMANALYMTDRGDPPYGNTVSRIELDGIKDEKELKRTVLVKKLHEAIGLSLDLKRGKMYITDLLGGLYEANLDGTEQKVLFPDLGDLTGIECVSS